MSVYKVVCSGKFPTLNEYIAAMNSHYHNGNKFKKEYQRGCELYIMRDLRGVKITNPVFIRYRYFEPNKKRDLDNIAGFFHKVFQDALTARGVLKNDGWAQIVGFEDRFFTDAKAPRVEIYIEELTTDKAAEKPKTVERQ